MIGKVLKTDDWDSLTIVACTVDNLCTYDATIFDHLFTIFDNLWQSLTIFDNPWQSLTIFARTHPHQRSHHEIWRHTRYCSSIHSQTYWQTHRHTETRTHAHVDMMMITLEMLRASWWRSSCSSSTCIQHPYPTLHLTCIPYTPLVTTYAQSNHTGWLRLVGSLKL